jgi:FkbM family methyltransferase
MSVLADLGKWKCSMSETEPGLISGTARRLVRRATVIIPSITKYRWRNFLFERVVQSLPDTIVEQLIRILVGEQEDRVVDRLSDETIEQLTMILVDKKQEFAAMQIIRANPDLMAARLVANAPEAAVREVQRLVTPFKFRQDCYSQEGEDLVLARIFEGRNDGFYVDVGACHPFRFSNTWLLYRRGWRGINIDATPNSMEEFRRERPRDINLQYFVSSSEASRRFFIMNEPALNSASKELVDLRSRAGSRYHLVETVTVESRSLAHILDENLPHGQAIDLLSVDVEGFDLDVLKSNDWIRYRPAIIIAELLGVNAGEKDEHEITRYLRDQGYTLTMKMFNSVLFMKR